MTSPRPWPPLTYPAADTGLDGRVAGCFSHHGYTVVWVRGEIDIATAPDLMRELATAVHAPQCRVIVDLTHVTFMDSTGLNALALARRKADAGNGEIRLVGARGMVSKTLHITGLERIFPLHSTVEESIGAGPVVRYNGTLVQLPEPEDRRLP